MDGTLTKDSFNKQCEAIVKLSSDMEDQFLLARNQMDSSQVYLCKTSKKLVNLANKVMADLLENVAIEFEYENEDLIESDDTVAKIDSFESNKEVLVQFEHHILYSESYNVPILYFSACMPDGRMLKLDEVWRLVPSTHQNAMKEKWSFITQQEHPYLLRPFYQLHPCHTASMMTALCAGQHNLSNYLLVWMSAVGPCVHLHIPLHYFSTVAK